MLLTIAPLSVLPLFIPQMHWSPSRPTVAPAQISSLGSHQHCCFCCQQPPYLLFHCCSCFYSCNDHLALLLASMTPPTLKLTTVLNGHPDTFSTGPVGTVYHFATKLPPCYHHRIPVLSTKSVFVINSLPGPSSTTTLVVNSFTVPLSIAAPDVNNLSALLLL